MRQYTRVCSECGITFQTQGLADICPDCFRQFGAESEAEDKALKEHDPAAYERRVETRRKVEKALKGL